MPVAAWIRRTTDWCILARISSAPPHVVDVVWVDSALKLKLKPPRIRILFCCVVSLLSELPKLFSQVFLGRTKATPQPYAMIQAAPVHVLASQWPWNTTEWGKVQAVHLLSSTLSPKSHLNSQRGPFLAVNACIQQFLFSLLTHSCNLGPLWCACARVNVCFLFVNAAQTLNIAATCPIFSIFFIKHISIKETCRSLMLPGSALCYNRWRKQD